MVKASDIRLIPVQSSSVAGVGYHVNSQTLVVSFVGGGKYAYSQVPKDVALGFFTPVVGEKRNGDTFFGKRSVGGYLAAQIKGKYAYEKLS